METKYEVFEIKARLGILISYITKSWNSTNNECFIPELTFLGILNYCIIVNHEISKYIKYLILISVVSEAKNLFTYLFHAYLIHAYLTPVNCQQCAVVNTAVSIRIPSGDNFFTPWATAFPQIIVFRGDNWLVDS